MLRSRKNKIASLAGFILAVALGFVPLSANMQETGNMQIFFEVEGACGNGVIEGTEECDDDNIQSGDGCSATCGREEVATEGGGGGPILLDLQIINLNTQPGLHEVSIFWETNRQARCQVGWGKTEEMSDDLVVEVVYKEEHEVRFMDLESTKRYYYRIICQDSNDKRADSGFRTIDTLAEPDRVPPGNVIDFQVEYDEDGGFVQLTWEKPDDIDLQAVKILRADDFFPQSFTEGEVIYNGVGDEFRDFNVELGKRYYYTAYAYDNNNNHSSGAIDFVDVPGRGEEPGERPGEWEIPEAAAEEQIEIEWDDFEFWAARQRIQLEAKQGRLLVLPGMEVEVRISKDSLPETLKSIIFTVSTGDEEGIEEARNYLFRDVPGKSYFSSQIAVPEASGVYSMSVLVVNYNNYQIGKAKGKLIIFPFGQVANTLLVDSFVLVARAAELMPGELDVVKDVKITLYRMVDGRQEKWEAESYGQYNPVYSNEHGFYGFVVPNGDYMIRADRYGFFSFYSRTVRAENNIINLPIDLIYIPRLNFYVLTGLALAALGANYCVHRKMRSRRKRKLEAQVAG